MFRFMCIALVSLALTNAEYLYGEQPLYTAEYASAYDNYKPRDYKFEYGVSDPHTGDHKSQWEVRENGIVRGAYSLLEADGTTRVVEYYADDTGFHADVKNIGTAVHDTPAPVVAPVIKATIADGIAYNGYGHGGLEHGYGAPIAAVQHVAPVSPIAAIAPIAKVEHIAPVQQVIAPEVQPLAQYAPIHYENYAPLLAKAAPAHQYKLVAQEAPIYAKYAPAVQTYHHEAPIEKYSPIAAAYYGPVEQVHHIQKEHAYGPIEHIQQGQIVLEKNHLAPIALQKATIAAAAPVYLKEQEINFQHAPAQNLYSHEINFAPSQEIKYAAPAQEIKYAAPILKYAQPAHDIKFAQEIKYAAPAQEIKYSAPLVKYSEIPEHYNQEVKYVQAPEHYSQEIKYAQAPEHYNQEVKYVQAPEHYNQEVKYVHAPEHHNQEIKYVQAPEHHNQEIKYVQAPEHYNQEIKYVQAPEVKYAQIPQQYNHDVKYTQIPQEAHYAKEAVAPIYYEHAKPQQNVQIVAKSADYDYFNGYKPEADYHHGY